MALDIIILITGIALLISGGDILVRGASSLAQSMGVSHLIIGLTIVAFGTSAPELAINMIASLQGKGDMSFGNIIGSNIANIGLVLGVTALIKPLNIRGSVISREIPMMILATIAALVMGFDHYLKDSPDMYDRSDAFFLLLLFSVFLYYTSNEVLNRKTKDPLFEQADQVTSAKKLPITVDFLFIIGGLAGLAGGGKLTVNAAVNIARSLDVSEAIIGLTIVAVGTSLPELVTSVIATLRGQTDLAIGNVVGSNIFNLLFVASLSSVVSPIPVPASGHADLLMMTFLSLLLFPLALSYGKRLLRAEGLLLLLLYFGFMTWRVYG